LIEAIFFFLLLQNESEVLLVVIYWMLHMMSLIFNLEYKKKLHCTSGFIFFF